MPATVSFPKRPASSLAAYSAIFSNLPVPVFNRLVAGFGGNEPNSQHARLGKRDDVGQAIVRCNTESSWRCLTGLLKFRGRLEGTPPIGKELPMDLTATLTVIFAIVSFGFLAALILGMI